MLKVTLILYTVFLCFQMLYIFVPLFYIKNKGDQKENNRPLLEKGVSILVPAYNEEKVILNCLLGIVNVKYKNFEAIIINDGSSDKTLDLLNSHLELNPVNRLATIKIPHEFVKEVYQSKIHPNIFVIDKINGGKADALNAGIEYSAKEIVITLDADSVLEPYSLQAVNKAFNDVKVIAAGGMVQISQGFYGDFQNPKPTFIASGLIRFQIFQYLTNFYLHKFTQTKFKSISVIAGAFGAFKKDVLFEINGYRKTVGEDMDITLRIQRLIKKKYKDRKLIFVPEALCYTECPATFKDLFSQRIRWQKGFIDCILNYRKDLFRNLRFSTSIYLLVDSVLLGTVNAFPTIILYVTIVFHESYMVALGLFSITFFIASYQSVTAIIVSRRFELKYSKLDYLKIALFIPFEIVTYRLLGLIFVTTGTIMYFKNKDSWAVSRRVGTNNQTYTNGVMINNKTAV
jgi:poly-beta-1,6-N-acetyl-D-glucosamine synthase